MRKSPPTVQPAEIRPDKLEGNTQLNSKSHRVGGRTAIAATLTAALITALPGSASAYHAGVKPVALGISCGSVATVSWSIGSGKPASVAIQVDNGNGWVDAKVYSSLGHTQLAAGSTSFNLFNFINGVTSVSGKAVRGRVSNKFGDSFTSGTATCA